MQYLNYDLSKFHISKKNSQLKKKSRKEKKTYQFAEYFSWKFAEKQRKKKKLTISI